MAKIIFKIHKPGIEEMCVTAIRNGANNFWEIVDHSDGAFPDEVRSVLQNLVRTGKALPEVLDESNITPQNVLLQDWPANHLFDGNWHFDEISSTKIIKKCLRLISNTKETALLGMPTVFYESIKDRLDNKFVLYDSNKSIVEWLNSKTGNSNNAIECDVFKWKRFNKKFGCVAIDPPWYVDYFKAFIWLAGRFTNIDANLIMVLPPLGTRPGMDKDRKEILEFCKTLGFTLEKIEKREVAYLTPIFEKNALKAQGFLKIPQVWRRADLVTFKKTKDIHQPRPKLSVHLGDWKALSVGKARFYFKNQISDFGKIKLTPLVEGNIAPTVSRRWPHWKNVDIVTHRNEIFSCGDPICLENILNSYSTSQSIEDLYCQYLERAVTKEERSDLIESISTLIGNI